MNLKQITRGVKSVFILRDSLYSNFSASIREHGEEEARAPREMIVGLADLASIKKVSVTTLINCEEAEYQNHLANFHSKLNQAAKERSSGAIWENKKLLRWSVKFGLLLNHILLHSDWSEDPLFKS